jgi:hypothetical protein
MNIEGVERVDPSTYLVRKYCKGGKPEYETLVFQLIDDGDGGTLRITNAENESVIACGHGVGTLDWKVSENTDMKSSP